jgi:hypothetical protein
MLRAAARALRVRPGARLATPQPANRNQRRPLTMSITAGLELCRGKNPLQMVNALAWPASAIVGLTVLRRPLPLSAGARGVKGGVETFEY